MTCSDMQKPSDTVTQISQCKDRIRLEINNVKTKNKQLLKCCSWDNWPPKTWRLWQEKESSTNVCGEMTNEHRSSVLVQTQPSTVTQSTLTWTVTAAELRLRTGNVTCVTVPTNPTSGNTRSLGISSSTATRGPVNHISNMLSTFTAKKEITQSK